MINQEQLNALIKVEVYKTLVDMGVISDQVSARECWKICGRRRFEALVKDGKIVPLKLQGYIKPKYSRIQVMKAIQPNQVYKSKKIML